MRQEEFEHLEKEALIELLRLKQHRLYDAHQRLKRARTRISKQKEIIEYQRSRIIELMPTNQFADYELIPKMDWNNSAVVNGTERAMPAS